MELRDVGLPTIGSRDVLLRIWGAGVCGSDVHVFRDEHPYVPPVIIGHEFSGEVEQVGDEVTHFRPGDRAVGDLETTAGRLGVDIDGAYASFMRIPSHLVHMLPSTISLREGVLVEPVVAVTHALLERSRIRPADFVVIIGPGPIGLVAVQVARLFSPRKIALTGLRRDRTRLAVGRAVGADHVLIAEEEPEKKILELTGGVGADLVVDCSGGKDSLLAATRMVKIGGWITVLGLWGQSLDTNLDPIPYNCLTVRGSWGWAGMESGDAEIRSAMGRSSWERALKILSLGKIDLPALITHELPLESWQEGLKICEERNGVKVILRPPESTSREAVPD